MKYKTKVIPENGGYVGYALLNDEVVFTTSVHRDNVMAIRELSNYIASTVPQKNIPTPVQRANQTGIQAPLSDNLVPSRKPLTSQTEYVPVSRTPPPIEPPRRCCGRG